MSIGSNTKGFTIIEVVLVLAIAGLIFLVVFLALPALQRGQRDTQRKNDAGRLISQITAYQTNNQGALPTDWTSGATFFTGYLKSGGQKFQDPSTGTDYEITVANGVPGSAPTIDPGDIRVYTNTKCDSSAATGLAVGSGARSYSALMYQEQGSFYCQSN